jgi:hypothetical protein
MILWATFRGRPFYLALAKVVCRKAHRILESVQHLGAYDADRGIAGTRQLCAAGGRSLATSLHGIALDPREADRKSTQSCAC